MNNKYETNSQDISSTFEDKRCLTVKYLLLPSSAQAPAPADRQTINNNFSELQQKIVSC
jgi:hypothetical protein